MGDPKNGIQPGMANGCPPGTSPGTTPAKRWALCSTSIFFRVRLPTPLAPSMTITRRPNGLSMATGRTRTSEEGTKPAVDRSLTLRAWKHNPMIDEEG